MATHCVWGWLDALPKDYLAQVLHYCFRFLCCLTEIKAGEVKIVF